MGAIRFGECGEREPAKDANDQERRIFRLRWGSPAQRDYANPAPVQSDRDFRCDEIAHQDADGIGEAFSEPPAILRI